MFRPARPGAAARPDTADRERAMEQGMSQIKAMKATVSGRVQGVNFRAWTQVEAQGRGLVGRVRNEADGTVTAHLEGPADAVDEMVTALHKGPPAAVVHEVTLSDATPTGATHFDIER
jgi:acylphosphatase